MNRAAKRERPGLSRNLLPEASMRAIIINAQDRTITATEIDGSLKVLQQIVGGMIEPVSQGLDDNPPLLRQ